MFHIHVYQDLTRVPSKADGSGSHWLWRVQQCFTYVISYCEISANFVLSIFTLLAFTILHSNLLHSFIVVCENEFVLIANIRCYCVNATTCLLIMLPSLSTKGQHEDSNPGSPGCGSYVLPATTRSPTRGELASAIHGRMQTKYEV